MHEESSSRRKVDDDVQEGAVPAYLLDRDETTRAKVCCYMNSHGDEYYLVSIFNYKFYVPLEGS